MILFDSTLFKDVPHPLLPGMVHLPLIKPDRVYTDGKIDEAKCRNESDRAHAEDRMVVLDDESSSPATLGAVARFFHEYRFSQRFGVYSVFPIRDYWSVIRDDTDDWHRKNGENRYSRDPDGRFNPHGPADEMDFVCPSLYTFYDNPAEWAFYAEANIGEARKFGKPVYPFLMPFYHDSNKTLGGKPIPGKAFGAQLELCRRLADGIVIWGGFNMQLDPSAEWYTELVGFLKGTA